MSKTKTALAYLVAFPVYFFFIVPVLIALLGVAIGLYVVVRILEGYREVSIFIRDRVFDI